MKDCFISLLLLVTLVSCHKQASKEAVNGLRIPTVELSADQVDLIYSHSKFYPNNSEISIGIIEDGRSAFYGVKRTHDTLQFIRNEKSIFEIGSISKVFTATILADLAYRNKLNLDDPIQGYVDYPIKTTAKITLQQLANHTAGLPRLPSNYKRIFKDHRNPYKHYDEERLIEYLKEGIETKSPVGEKYTYSNIGVGLLGYLLTKHTNTAYNDLLQELIFSKYEMNSSTTKRDELKNKLVNGLNEKGYVIPNWDLNVLVGAGGVLSNVEDLSKFVNAHFDPSNKALELSRQTTFYHNENLALGLGWHIYNPDSDHVRFWHNGATGGYKSCMAMDVKRKNAVIVLSNVSLSHNDKWDIDGLCFKLMDGLTVKQ